MRVTANKILLIALYSAGIATAQAKQINLPMVYEPIAKAKQGKLLQTVSGTGSCTFAVLPPEDQRQNTQTIGYNGANLTALKVNDWLQTALTTVVGQSNNPSAQNQIELAPKLTRLYTYHESMNILGVTSVTIDFKANGRVVDTRQYRGFYAKTNWAGADGEYVTALNDAVNNMLPKLASELPEICKLTGKTTS